MQAPKRRKTAARRDDRQGARLRVRGAPASVIGFDVVARRKYENKDIGIQNDLIASREAIATDRPNRHC